MMETPVYVNVYDMVDQNHLTYISYLFFGLGVFHSGLEIDGKEYNFGGHNYDFSGVFLTEPKKGPPGVTFKESILVGYTTLNAEQINYVLQEISQEYTGKSYLLLSRNCNHFTSDLCSRITGKSAPGWINRLARVGTLVPCMVPKTWIDPPGGLDDTERPFSDSEGGLSDDDERPLTRI